MENHMEILCLILVVPLTLYTTMLAGVTRFMASPSLQVSWSYEFRLIVHLSRYYSSTFII